MIKKIKTPYFPSGLRYATPVFIAGGVFLMVMGYWILAILCMIASLFILTTHYVTEIDVKKKRFSDYLKIAFFKLHEESRKYDRVEKIIVTKANHSQTINTRVQSRQLNWSEYTATLQYNYTRRLDLVTRNDKRELLIRIKEFARIFDTVVEDQTTNRHYIIDLTRVE